MHSRPNNTCSLIPNHSLIAGFGIQHHYKICLACAVSAYGCRVNHGGMAMGGMVPLSVFSKRTTAILLLSSAPSCSL